MAAPILPMLKCSIVYNLHNFPPILVKFVTKFIVGNVHGGMGAAILNI